MKPVTTNILFFVTATSLVLSLSSILYSCSTSSTNSSLEEKVTKVEKKAENVLGLVNKASDASELNSSNIEDLFKRINEIDKVKNMADAASENAETALAAAKRAQRLVATASNKLDAVAQDRWVQVPSDKTDVEVYWLAQCDNGKPKKLSKFKFPDKEDAKIELRRMCGQ